MTSEGKREIHSVRFKSEFHWVRYTVVIGVAFPSETKLSNASLKPVVRA